MKIKQGRLLDSSYLIRKALERPDLYGQASIDMLSVTIPFSNENVGRLLKLLSTRSPQHMYKQRTFSNQEVGAYKYLRQLTCHFKNGSIFYIHLFGLNKHQNQLRIQFNPNTVGLSNAAMVLCEIRELIESEDYVTQILRGNVTGVHYTWDIPNLPFENVIFDYAYRTSYRPFFDQNKEVLTGLVHGNKSGCPLTSYDKAAEQGGEYSGCNEYTRFEKQHKPRARGKKSMFNVATMDSQRYSFQGVQFFDPLLLNCMPSHVLKVIQLHGLKKAIDLIGERDSRILRKRVDKYQLTPSKEFRSILIQCYQQCLLSLKQCLIDPVGFL